MSVFLQQVVNGLSIGSIYSVFAIGCTLIFGVLNIINLAQGAFLMVSACVGLVAARAGLPLPLTFLVATCCGGILGGAAELLMFRPLRQRGGHRWMGLVASLALARLMVGAAQEFFGTQVQGYPPNAITAIDWDFGGVRIQALQVTIFAAAILLMLALGFMLKRTSVGRAIRTVAFSEDVARIVGVRVGQTNLTTFLIAGALAGASGLLLGMLFNVVSPFMGENALIKGLTVIILGGLGNIPGAVVGGFLLGLIEVFSVAYVSSSFRDAIGFGLIFLILLIKPTGLVSGFEERRA
jgi:branched-chain amino acid transport system permease protein